eukprot:6960198-Prymnesium_polylepis.1
MDGARATVRHTAYLNSNRKEFPFQRTLHSVSSSGAIRAQSTCFRRALSCVQRLDFGLHTVVLRTAFSFAPHPALQRASQQARSHVAAYMWIHVDVPAAYSLHVPAQHATTPRPASTAHAGVAA